MAFFLKMHFERCLGETAILHSEDRCIVIFFVCVSKWLSFIILRIIFLQFSAHDHGIVHHLSYCFVIISLIVLRSMTTS